MNTAKISDDIEEKDIIFFKTATVDQEGKDETANTDEGLEAAQAYDPETGEINWDCPCLGPMVKPPCGELFKSAFSCFVYSKTEPKGSDCVEQFQAMQNCFQQYPEIYGTDEDEAKID
jgi:intermembrane space import and assembly protein 40